MSNTLICISEVPDFGGFPPSIAVKMSGIIAFFSRSRAFCSTNSADTPSPPLCVAREKYSSFSLIVTSCCFSNLKLLSFSLHME
uniref:Uncharacterized protein n=1 Tax=Myripristis murdjan TaxID=586833 RepID=A0A667WUI6_9TELE